MKKYRVPLLFAVLLIVWLAVGPQLIEQLTTPNLGAVDGLPSGVELQGTLYYTQGFDGIWQIDLANGAVSQWWQPPDGGLVTGISASPDGTQLAIAYAPPAEEGFQVGTTGLYLSGRDQPDLVPVFIREIRNESYRNPSWSPDGQWLYFTHLKPKLNETGATAGVDLTIEQVALSDLTRSEIILSGAEQPALSPNSAQIAFVSFDPSSYAQGLGVANVDDLETQEVVIASGSFMAVTSPRFSADSQSIVFSASGEMRAASAAFGVVRAHGLPWNIWRVSLVDGTLEKLTPATLDGPWITWSPNGEHLAVLAAEGVFVIYEGRFYRLTEVTSEGEITWAGGL